MRTLDATFKHRGREAYVLADVEIKVVDDSFDHEFGTCHREHEEIGTIDVLECCYADTDDPIDWDYPGTREDILQALQDRLN